MTYPPPLKPNDTIGITCPARKMTAEELAPAIALFESWGYQVKIGSTVGGECDQFSGTDEERAADMQQLLDDPTVKAIVSARGGYGNVRIVDKLDWTRFKQNPKWLVGYSDSTVLHAHLQKLGFASLHAPMPLGFKTNTPEALDSIRTALSGKALAYTVAPHEYNRMGIAEGELIGGNLSVLVSISGSASDIDTKGKILFLEDLDEYLYHIDRMMNQLDRSGKLEHLAGLVIGGMSDMRDNAIPFGKDAYQIVQERVSKYGYPVCYGFPAGHIDDNRTLIMGAKHKLEVTADVVSLLSVHGR
jgi:muramoyltetrapeptide carboxypeptidase